MLCFAPRCRHLIFEEAWVYSHPFQVFASGRVVSTGKDWRVGQCGPLHGCTKFVPLAQHRVLSLLSSGIASALCLGLLERPYLVSTWECLGRWTLCILHTCKDQHPQTAKNKTLHSFIPEAGKVLQTALGRTSTASMRHLANVTHWLARCLASIVDGKTSQS